MSVIYICWDFKMGNLWGGVLRVMGIFILGVAFFLWDGARMIGMIPLNSMRVAATVSGVLGFSAIDQIWL